MTIFCCGDSNTWGYDPRGPFGGRYDSPWPEQLAKKLHCNVISDGENGREIPNSPISPPADTDLLIIMLGTNDLLQSRTPEAACGKMARFLEALPLERQRILLIAPPPMVFGEWVPDQTLIDASAALTKCYQALAWRLGIRFADAGQWNIPLAFDGVHLTQEGHSLFADHLYKELTRL